LTKRSAPRNYTILYHLVMTPLKQTSDPNRCTRNTVLSFRY